MNILQFTKIIAISIMIASCSENNKNTINHVSGFYERCDLLTKFEISNSNDTIIYGKQGTKLFIPKNSFKQKNIEIQLLEFYDMVDMLFYGLTTNHENGILVSGGMIHISALNNNKNVNMIKDKHFKIYFKTEFLENSMKPFIGNITKNKISTKENFIWKDTDDIIEIYDHYLYVLAGKDTLDKFPDLESMFFRSKSLNWINVDKMFEFRGDKGELTIKIKTDNNPIVRVLFRNRRTILSGLKNNNEYIFDNLPVGDSIKLVAFNRIDNNLYWSCKDMVVTNNEIVYLALDNMSIEKIKEDLIDIK